jgi:nitrogen-specific signal transduction histidine kinase/CheY-like chemotaxis protein
MPYGRRVDGVATDVTDLRRAEDERRSLEATFQQAQRLESLGVLAGGIAHDFNNLLVSMLGHADLALQHLAANDPARKDIGSIEKAARRAAELCRQMLAYAGKGSPKTEPLDLRETVEEMGELLAASTSKQVKTRYEFAEDLPLVEADASQIRQLVMNLITNASEALSGPGGGIDVRAREVFVSAAELASFTLSESAAPGRFVELSVADDGCGMDAATLGRIFEPFYTRKFAGRGLGLAAALGIVRRHRGAIRIESEPGHGTRATLLLPALERDVPTRPLPRASEEAWRGSGTVLLVDDQADAREVGTLMLQRAGFQVVAACDGDEALELFRTHRSDVVCVLLDLTMPGMGGREVHAALRTLSDDVPIVLCSGFPEDAAQELFEGNDLAGFLEKPFTSASLLQSIRRALDTEHEGPA